MYIENENGISLEDCEKVSNSITGILDEKDHIKEQYFLEVSSTRSGENIKKRQAFGKQHWRRRCCKIV